jgi:hypothetical protein
MHHTRRILAAAFTLVSTALAPATSPAWWGGPGYGNNSGLFDTDVGGNFGFNTAFRGRGYGNAYNRHYGYRDYPYSRPAAPLWVIRGVNFKYDSAELTPGSMQALNRVATTLRNRPGPALEVGGHASAEGDGPYNLDLSRRRAQTVRAYLVKRDVDPERLTSRGYGETRPLVANFSEAGRRLNRRVELSPVLASGQ